jgi:acyl-CoA reductase-like NAD-dependent aldehyde dehydrogenase
VESTAADVNAVVEAAAAAFTDPAWRGMTPSARGRLLWRIADLVEEHAAELGELESRDQGQSVAFARGSMGGAADMLRYFAGWCRMFVHPGLRHVPVLRDGPAEPLRPGCPDADRAAARRWFPVP